MDFKKGDLVRLRSGGPVMTVHSADYSDTIQCTWFDAKQARQLQSFDQETLDKFQPGPMV